MSAVVKLALGRRALLKLGLQGTAALVLGVGAGTRRARAASSTALNLFVAVGADGTVVVQNPFTEMGQGVYTAIPMLVAEELDVDLARVRSVQAPHGDSYKIMYGGRTRFTGGSMSVRSSFEPLRQAGAVARTMLVRAAAREWRVPESECSTASGRVHHAASGRWLSYGDLAPAAARGPVPKDVALRSPTQWRLLGRPAPRLDTAEKVSGTAQFGPDLRLPGMLYAAVRQTPVFGADVETFDAESVRALPGVVAVERIAHGVAVLGRSTWQARQALAALKLRDAAGPNPALDSAQYIADSRTRLDEPGAAAESAGDIAAALRGAARVLSADYVAPLLAHATLEPMNCTALVTAQHCTVWAPNQGVDSVAEAAARVTGLPLGAITVHTPYIGGGFGRRSMDDFVEQAVTLARAHPGRPVQVLWDRAEDIQHDHYRPATVARLRAGLDRLGYPVAWHTTLVGDGPMRQLMPDAAAKLGYDDSVVEGAIEQPYAIAARRIDYVSAPFAGPVGWWRSVGNSHTAFFKECFMDELAHAANADPVQYRRALLGKADRHRRVLDRVAEMAAWKPQPWTASDGSRRAMGVALHESFGSIVGEIAEVSVTAGAPRVHQVWCVVDCGQVVNPAIVIMQMESGIAFGLSAALGEEITIVGGKVVQSNFDDYPILGAAAMPAIEVQIIESGAALGGIGEPGTPPIAPAVCNALFTLTGKRIRALPLARERWA